MAGTIITYELVMMDNLKEDPEQVNICNITKYNFVWAIHYNYSSCCFMGNFCIFLTVSFVGQQANNPVVVGASHVTLSHTFSLKNDHMNNAQIVSSEIEKMAQA